MSSKRDFLNKLADLCDEYKVDFCYTTDDDGIHIGVGGEEVFVGFLFDAPAELRAAANDVPLSPIEAARLRFALVDDRARELAAHRLDAVRFRDASAEPPKEGQEVLAVICPYNVPDNAKLIVHARYIGAQFLDPIDGDELHPVLWWIPKPNYPEA